MILTALILTALILTALILTALILTALIAWFYGEFGLTVALFVLASALFSQWLTVFGRNLWWSLWSFYLPMVALLYYLQANATFAPRQLFHLSLLALLTVLLQCLLTGYEYITTTLVMLVVPVVYYLMRNQTSASHALKRLTIIGSASCLAILVSFAILCLQIATVQGSCQDGMQHIIYSFQKRTRIEPAAWQVGDRPTDFAASLDAGTVMVLGKYLVGTYFDASNYLAAGPFVEKYLLKVRYIYLIGLFALASLILSWRAPSVGRYNGGSAKCCEGVC